MIFMLYVLLEGMDLDVMWAKQTIGIQKSKEGTI